MWKSEVLSFHPVVWGLDSGHQTWRKAPLPAEPSISSALSFTHVKVKFDLESGITFAKSDNTSPDISSSYSVPIHPHFLLMGRFLTSTSPFWKKKKVIELPIATQKLNIFLQSASNAGEDPKSSSTIPGHVTFGKSLSTSDTWFPYSVL